MPAAKLVGITNSDNSRSTGKHLDKFIHKRAGRRHVHRIGNNVECKCPERHYTRTTGLHNFFGKNYPAFVKQKNSVGTTISGATESFVMLANDRLN